MSSRVRLRAIVVLCLVPVACARPEPTRSFELRGQLLAIRPNHELLVKHDDIKGFMPAMTMPYRVRDAGALPPLAAGDLITATLVVGENDAWLTRLEKIGSAPLPPDAGAEDAAPASILREGDAAPDTALADDRGRPLSLRDWRGSAVAVTFIYTRCPLPQFCPLMDRRFAEVQRLAAADAILNGRVRLLSVSFDPDADTAAVLRAHAAKLGADPEVWRFATAPREVIDPFANAFGVSVMREADRTITHNLRTAVIDPEGQVVALYSGSDWTPERLAADLKRALAR